MADRIPHSSIPSPPLMRAVVQIIDSTGQVDDEIFTVTRAAARLDFKRDGELDPSGLPGARTASSLQCWARWKGGPLLAVSISRVDGETAGETAGWAGVKDGPPIWVAVESPDWAWLAGPDGKVVRVVPPKGLTP